jgi:hypothetical protein
LITGTNYPDLDTLAAVIARSQIVVAAMPADIRRFPAGFDSVDIAILEWIAAEGSRAGHELEFVRM